MIFSSACQDIIRAIVYLNGKEDLVQVKKISEDLKVPFHFLSKNMQIVAKAGLITSKRGVDGGMKLAKNPSDIKIMDIIKVVDGDKYFDGCLLGIGLCESENPCALHEEWTKRKDELVEIFGAISLQDIAEDLASQKILRV
ncbi:MAG: hypothetical protein RL154_246 [Pseudomonadota bacterium]|jgi:Rrf2 family protein